MATGRLNTFNLIDFEVLYIGQAFGDGGSRNALDRLLKHETLQKIAVKGVPAGSVLMLLLPITTFTRTRTAASSSLSKLVTEADQANLLGGRAHPCTRVAGRRDTPKLPVAQIFGQMALAAQTVNDHLKPGYGGARIWRSKPLTSKSTMAT